MSRARWLLFIVGIAVAAWLAWWHFGDQGRRALSSVAAPVAAAVPVTRSAKSLSLPAPRHAERSEEAKCRAQWEALGSIDLAEFGLFAEFDSTILRLQAVRPLLERISQLQKDHPCRVDDQSGFRSRSVALSKWCGEALRLGTEKASQPGDVADRMSLYIDGMVPTSVMDKCLSSFQELREDAARLATQGVPLAALNSLALLHDVFQSTGRQKPIDSQRLAAIADRMRELDPQGANTAHLSARVEYARWRNENVASDWLKRIDPGPDLGSAETVRLKMQYELEQDNLETVQRVAERFLSSPAHANLANYYLAQVAYRSGDIDGAKRYLAEVGRGAYADLKDLAYIAKKRLETEDLSLPTDVPLFPLPGVSFTVAYAFPIHLGGEGPDTMYGGDSGFILARDDFSALVLNRYRNYWHEAMGLPRP